MKLLIMYPSNATSLILAKLLKCDTYFYCPDHVHLTMAGTIQTELQIEFLVLKKKVEIIGI